MPGRMSTNMGKAADKSGSVMSGGKRKPGGMPVGEHGRNLQQVEICHKPPAETISVGENDVSAHLAQGDTIGACTGETGFGYGCYDDPCYSRTWNTTTRYCDSVSKCDDGNGCTADYCNFEDGTCFNVQCEDRSSDPCRSYTCTESQYGESCTSISACDDGNGCTYDSCRSFDGINPTCFHTQCEDLSDPCYYIHVY